MFLNLLVGFRSSCLEVSAFPFPMLLRTLVLGLLLSNPFLSRLLKSFLELLFERLPSQIQWSQSEEVNAVCQHEGDSR